MAIRDETRMLLESMTRLFEDHCTKQVDRCRRNRDISASPVGCGRETGVPLAALPESAGGADAEWSDLYAVLRVAAASPHRSRWPKPCWLVGSPHRAGWNLERWPDDGRPGALRRPADAWQRDGNGWRLSGAATPAALCLARHPHRADRQRSRWRDGGRAGRHRRRASLPQARISPTSRATPLTFTDVRLSSDAGCAGQRRCRRAARCIAAALWRAPP